MQALEMDTLSKLVATKYLGIILLVFGRWTVKISAGWACPRGLRVVAPAGTRKTWPADVGMLLRARGGYDSAVAGRVWV